MLGAAAACSKNGPGVIEGVANDIGNEVDGAGNTVEGVGQDVTDTVDGPPKNPPPAAGGGDAADGAVPAPDEDAESR